MEALVIGSMLCLYIMVAWIVTRTQNHQNQNHKNHPCRDLLALCLGVGLGGGKKYGTPFNYSPDIGAAHS